MEKMAHKPFKPVTHVLFDMDGLLLDTEDLYSKSYQAVNDRYGAGEYTFDFKVSLMGTRPLNCAQKMIAQYNLPITPEEFIEATTKEQEKLFPGVSWMPGMLKLVHHLHKVTNNYPFFCTLQSVILNELLLFFLFEALVLILRSQKSQ